MNSSLTRSFISTSRRSAAIAISLLGLLCAAGVHAETSEKKIGFSVQVHTEGFLSATVAKISVTQVSPDSQAQSAGVAVGDELVKIQEIIVPGNHGSTLKEHMTFVPGVPKKMTFKRPTGAQYEVVFRRAAAPMSAL